MIQYLSIMNSKILQDRLKFDNKSVISNDKFFCLGQRAKGVKICVYTVVREMIETKYGIFVGVTVFKKLFFYRLATLGVHMLLV